MARIPRVALPIVRVALSIAMFGGVALAQGDLKSRLHPITSPLRHAGVYHVATGTWTRGASPNAFAAPVIYNNTCNVIYFTTMLSTERFQHRSRIPSPNGPTTDSIFWGSTNTDHRYDERPGCSSHYSIVGFEVEYCSSHVGTIDWQYEFASSYAECDAADMVPERTIDVTGLPGGTSTGAQACWTIDVDLAGDPGGYLTLTSDGDGTYDGPSTVDQFGWSFGPSSATVAADFTGPIVAGNYTWDGCHDPACQLCTGTDGTIWDSAPFPGRGPTPEGEVLGTGMSSNDFFRDTGGPVSSPSGPGCYFFGTIHSDFYLKLYASFPCGKEGPMLRFCAPGVGGIVTCPCGNPQNPPGAIRGCDNFVGGGTGGASLNAWGDPVVSFDTLTLIATAEAPAATISVLFQGTTNSANQRYGAGVRCVGGTLKRLYKGNASGGTIQFPNDGVSFHDRSAAKGFPINAPTTLYYFCAYRNSAANGHPGCPGLSFGFNSTNAGAIFWMP